MKPTLLARLGWLAMVSVTAFAGVASPTGARSYSFSAALTGDVRAPISGSATFGRVAGGVGKPTIFTLSLSDNGVSGIFALHATGFLAEQPNRENQRVFVQGSFSAKGSN